MEPIESNSLATFSVCFVILIAILFIIGYFLVQWGVRQLKNDRVNDRVNDRINEAEYEAMYFNIQKHIKEWPVDLSIYYKIKQELWRLKNLKWKNKEETNGLYIEFHMGRFLNIALSERKKRIDKSY